MYDTQDKICIWRCKTLANRGIAIVREGIESKKRPETGKILEVPGVGHIVIYQAIHFGGEGVDDPRGFRKIGGRGAGVAFRTCCGW